MNRVWTGKLIVVAGALLAAAASVDASPWAALTEVRHRSSSARTRVVLDLDRPASYKVFSLTNPDRIAINIPNTSASGVLREVPVAEGAVRKIRVNRLSWGAQVVLDLRKPTKWNEFNLAAVEGMPHRIVIDLEESEPEIVVVPRTGTSRRDWVIAIDAGHGGTDPGAIGKGRIVEKVEAFEIAKRLARVINAREGFKAVLTRERDVFISLPDRTEIAREKSADIFVSIHLNSAPQSSARGVEVYFLSPGGAKTTANRLLSDTRRAAQVLGVEGAKSADLVQMLLDVNQQSMMERSATLAEAILKSVGRERSLPPARSIKQRAFAVLKSITMPSVMVETGFLTNAHDAAILKSSDGKDRMAEAIADGIVAFFEKHPPPASETGRVVVHQVREGETLWRISRRYNTSVASIQRANQMGTSMMIRAGQELVIREGYETN